MATLDDTLERVGQSQIVSKLDLAKGFYQIPVAEADVEETAFITPFGICRQLHAIRLAKCTGSFSMLNGGGIRSYF